MKKSLKWENANKLAVVFGIIGGIYLIVQVITAIFSDKLKFDSEISINDFSYPIEKNTYSFRDESRKIIPKSLDSDYLSRNITDTLTNNLDLSKYYQSSIRGIIENAIPTEINRDNLVDKIDSLVRTETYPMRTTRCYVETYLRNKGDKIAKELRLELPTDGYYELYTNGNFEKKGEFQNNIFIGELRPENRILLKIWSFEIVSEYDLDYSKELKYTFDNGFIIPAYLKSIKAKGFLFWIYKNPIWAFYFLLWLPIYFIYVVMSNWTRKK
jgi:hypothetical protein